MDTQIGQGWHIYNNARCANSTHPSPLVKYGIKGFQVGSSQENKKKALFVMVAKTQLMVFYM